MAFEKHLHNTIFLGVHFNILHWLLPGFSYFQLCYGHICGFIFFSLSLSISMLCLPQVTSWAHSAIACDQMVRMLFASIEGIMCKHWHPRSVISVESSLHVESRSVVFLLGKPIWDVQVLAWVSVNMKASSWFFLTCPCKWQGEEGDEICSIYLSSSCLLCCRNNGGT